MDVQTLTESRLFASPFTTPQPQNAYATCAGCAAPVSMVGDGYWLIDAEPRHVGCVDWSRRPPPYLWARDNGVKLLARLNREGTPAPEKLVRAVAYLGEVARAWPPPDPAAALERAGLAAVVVEHWKVKLRKTFPPSPRSR